MDLIRREYTLKALLVHFSKDTAPFPLNHNRAQLILEFEPHPSLFGCNPNKSNWLTRIDFLGNFTLNGCMGNKVEMTRSDFSTWIELASNR
jgi:hypothetical protein